MTMITVEREELQEIIRNLPDEKVIAAVKLMRRLQADSDPFYCESNMRHLLAVKSDAQAGVNMFVHDLIEVDDE